MTGQSPPVAHPIQAAKIRQARLIYSWRIPMRGRRGSPPPSNKKFLAAGEWNPSLIIAR